MSESEDEAEQEEMRKILAEATKEKSLQRTRETQKKKREDTI